MRSLCSRCWSSSARRLPSLFRRVPPPLPLRSPLLSPLSPVTPYGHCCCCSSSRPRTFATDVTVTNKKPHRRHDAMNAVNEFVDKRPGCNGTAPYTVFIEGNVGSGKTTFLEQFEDCPNVFMATEPVHKWQDVRGHNFLGLMYDDPKRWSFAFQSIVQRTMLELHQARPEPGQNIKIMERSIYSARNIFVENLYKDNLMAAPEYAVLDAWYKWLIGNVEIKSDLIIYLRTDPEIAFQRIKTRNRSEEKNVSFEYIKHLHELHDKWLNVHNTDVPKNTPVVIVDSNQSMELVKEQFKGIRDLITRNASAIIDPKTNHNISDISQSIHDVQHNISPCKLVPDTTIVPAQRV